MTMRSPIKDRVIVDIGLTVEKHKDIIPELLPAHVLSGYDTVACCMFWYWENYYTENSAI